MIKVWRVDSWLPTTNPTNRRLEAIQAFEAALGLNMRITHLIITINDIETMIYN